MGASKDNPLEDGGGKSMFHVRCGIRNTMLLDNGPLLAAPQPTPLKNIVKQVESGSTEKGASESRSKGGRKAADPLNELESPTGEGGKRKAAAPNGAETEAGSGEGGNAEEEEQELEPEPGKVYICHKWSVNTQEWIQRMLAEFDKAGVNYMQSDMSDSYIDAVEFHIARCEYVVLLVTKEYAVALHNAQARSHKEVRCRVTAALPLPHCY